jgi:hypothetical protein
VILGKGDKPRTAIAAEGPPPVATVAPAPPAPAPPAPVPETGKLEIETIPSGANVRIDNRDGGSTPIELTLPHGRHKLHVELAGYTAIDADQDVHTSERTTTVITLVAAKTTAKGPATATKPKPNKIVTTTRPLTAGSATSSPATTPVDPYGAPNDVAPDKPVTPDKPKAKPQNGTQSMPNPY